MTPNWIPLFPGQPPVDLPSEGDDELGDPPQKDEKE